MPGVGTIITGTVTALPANTPIVLGSIPATAGQMAAVTLDRTLSGGLNAAGPGASITIEIQASSDGGTTWQLLVTCTTAGGGAQSTGQLAVSVAAGQITQGVLTASTAVSVTPALAQIAPVS